jgi:bifunctional non-homologous end joining protein LigD
MPKPAVVDGEVVSLDESGKSHFEWLQNYQRAPQGKLTYFVFDLLWYDGHDLRSLPLIERKELLAKLLEGNDVLRYSDHVRGQGKRFFDTATSKRLEGVMAKSCSSQYKEDFRSKQWLKIKTHLRQEVVIGGFTEPRGSRKHLGALLVGVHRDGKLHYAGHVGGGIPPEQIADLRKQLEKLERKDSPFAEGNFKANAPVHWVEPKLLAEVKFAEWTDDKHLRQPIFVGLRSDKEAKEVTAEKPIHSDNVTHETDNESRVNFTHRDKVFWPEAGFTKGDLIDYYRTMADTMLPYLKGRPHNLYRQPGGYKDKGFFQKDVAGAVPDWATTISIYSESNEKDINYLLCNTWEDMELMVQLGSIEINPWSSRVNNLDKPDWAVLDLDPEDIAFTEVVKAAIEAKKVFDEISVPAIPKTSGKTGLHIYVPLGAKYTYEQAKNFIQLVGNLVQARLPDTTSLERKPEKRQHKIYLDYLQNRQGQTLAAPYSVRPTKEASVSTPLHWDEVNSKLDPKQFTMKSMPKRLKQVGDLWQPVIGQGIDLKKVLARLG